MANRELFSIRVRNRPRDSTTTVDGSAIVTSIPKTKRNKKRTRKKFSLSVSKPKDHDKKNLRCTYCHEEGALTDTVKCDGSACGAIYHRACWKVDNSWRTSRGCVLLDCSSTSASTFTEKVKRSRSRNRSGQLTFVLTGKMSRPRSEITAQIEAAGHRVTTSVSSRTNYVVVGVKPGSKYSNALARGISTITEGELSNVLGQNHSSGDSCIVMLDGFDEEVGYEVGAEFVKTTGTLVVLRDDNGGIMRFNRRTGRPTPATLEEFGKWHLSEQALRDYGTLRVV